LLYPIGSIVYYSLFKYNVTKPRSNGFIGLQNFQDLLSDQLFWDSLRFTTQWVVVEVGLQLVLGLGLAPAINETFVGRSLARSLVFSPWAVAGVVLALPFFRGE
jgi:multiple sugar transport system permease protein